jgi:methionyl-tRNA synthetase
MEYLMLSGGQFSKSRKHAVWLPSFLDRFDPDTLRYYLSINMPENHDTDFNWPDFVEKINSELIAAYGNFVHRVLTLGARLPGGGGLSSFEDLSYCDEEMQKLSDIHVEITTSLERHRYKEALRSVMRAAQLGNQMLQAATPWKFLKDLDGEGAKESMAKLSFGWRLSRFLSIMTQPFLPFSAQKLWKALGEEGEVSQVSWQSAIDWKTEIKWSDEVAEPLFKRLDLEEILSQEKDLASDDSSEVSDPTHGVKGSKKNKKEEKKMPEGTTHLDFETFMEVELKVGKITNVDDHENADKLFVVKIDDGTENGRTICAGLKEYYTAEQMVGKSVVFVANLKPRKLRGVMSEGMMLAADDGDGGVSLVTIDGEISPGSQVR